MRFFESSADTFSIVGGGPSGTTTVGEAAGVVIVASGDVAGSGGAGS